MIIDSHVHIWPRWPYQPPVPDDESRGSVENLLYTMDQNGVDAALVVNARIERSADNNDYGAEAVLAHPDRLHHVADIDSRWSDEYHAPGAPDRLRATIAKYRPTGISHYLKPENDGWLLSKEGLEFLAVAEEARLIVNLAVPPAWFGDLRTVAARFPGVTFLVNHLAVVMLYQPGIDEGLRLVLDNDELPNLLVKVSGYYYGSDRPWDYPYADRSSIVKAFYDNWGPSRMIWASDFPSVLAHMSYRQSIEVLREHAGFISGPELDDIFGGNMQRILTDRRGESS